MMDSVAHKVDFSSLARLLKPGQVLSDPVEMIAYEIDASIDSGQPDGVVIPLTSQETALVARWASQHGIALVARGAGTGLSGGSVAGRGGLVVEFSRMNHILEFDTAGRSIVMEPGVTNLRVDEYVKKEGLYYPPDPASGRCSTMGGNVAENAGGPHCFKYGVTTNYLTGLQAVLADGRILRFGGRALDYPEYDFLGLLVGNEGTLALITEISARLTRNPPGVKTLMAAFDSVVDAGEAVSKVIARGMVPATLEMMDQKMMRIIEDFVHAGLPIDAGSALIVEVDGYPESLVGQMEEVITTLRANKAYDLRLAQSAEEREKIWYGRKSAAGAVARISPMYYILDGTVPRSKLAETLSAINEACDALNQGLGYVFHAGDGNLHPIIFIEDLKDPRVMQRIQAAGRRIMEICVENGGSITGEHGVGMEKRTYMRLMFTQDEMDAMLDVKAIFDPQGLMNPGKIFPDDDHERQAAPASEQVELPLAEAAPASTQEAAELMRAWSSAGRAVRVRGGGTKSGLLPLVADHEQRSLSTRALCGVREYALADLYVTAAAGTTLADLQAELGRDQMWVPLTSPWQASTLGGMVATNFNAPLRMRYGGIRDLVLAATVVLPDGRIQRLGRPLVKNVAGYDMVKLFIGSYGTLGLITEVTFKLAPLPRARASLSIPVDNLGRGLDLGVALLRNCLVASALLLQQGGDDATGAPYSLIYTAEGVPEDVDAELAQAIAILQKGGVSGWRRIEKIAGTEAWQAWMQQAAAPSSAQNTGTQGIRSNLLRVGVAPKDLPALARTLLNDQKDLEFLADLANGFLYLRGVQDMDTCRQMALSLGGYAVLLAGGSEGGSRDPWGYQPESLDLMRALKSRWDASGAFNPGAFLV